MNPLRIAALWATDNRRLRTRLPKHRFVRRTVARFMPGEHLDDAVAAAERLRSIGLPTILTFLGENATTETEAETVVAEHEAALERIAERGLDSEVSLKPTHLGLDRSPQMAATRLERLAKTAADRDTWLWLDMESYRYVEPTVALYDGLRRGHDRVGICLQAYLRRTPADIDRLLPLDPSLRLVKGATASRLRCSSAAAARPRRPSGLAFRLIRGRGERGRVVLGTHDVALVRRIEDYAAVHWIGRDDVEVAMLFGIRSADQRRFAAERYKIRTLISYGTHWYPWFMRRIAEKPVTNSLLALRNLVAR